MITRGQAAFLSARIHTWIALMLVGVFSLAMVLIIWQVAYNQNPLADAMASALYQNQNY